MNNTFPITSKISTEDRILRNEHSGCLIWFTGLPSSGKSTIAVELERVLFDLDKSVLLLNGDNIRNGLCSDLTFSHEDRTENIRRTGEVAKLFVDAGFICLAAFISPYTKDRENVRAMVSASRFIEVYMNTPLDVCERNDPNGLYKKARLNEISNFTGVSAPYEPPLTPDLKIDRSTTSVIGGVSKIIDILYKRKII